MEAALRRSTGVGVAFSLLKRYTINDLTLAPRTTSLSALDVFTFSRGVYLISIQASDLNEPGLGVGPTLHYVVYHAARRLLVGYPEVLVHFILSAHYLLRLTTFRSLLTHPLLITTLLLLATTREPMMICTCPHYPPLAQPAHWRLWSQGLEGKRGSGDRRRIMALGKPCDLQPRMTCACP